MNFGNLKKFSRNRLKYGCFSDFNTSWSIQLLDLIRPTKAPKIYVNKYLINRSEVSLDRLQEYTVENLGTACSDKLGCQRFI